ncbi:hypothetical protein GIB67_040137, partial [Kingdonia uniflora]
KGHHFRSIIRADLVAEAELSSQRGAVVCSPSMAIAIVTLTTNKVIQLPKNETGQDLTTNGGDAD